MKADNPSHEAYTAAAFMLACEVNVLKAIGVVEAGSNGAFLDDDTPVILFERHLFSQYTSRKYDGTRINNTDWGLISAQQGGGYGPVAVQHEKLEAASRLDRDAALRACSWGLFQILGNHHDACGYPELQRFINAMYRSADDHLRALTMFIRHDHRKVDALRSHDWATFARLYNGVNYAQNHYDTKLAHAYAGLEAL